MNILGRDGNISFIRIGTLAAILGVLIVVGGLAIFFVDRASHQRPFEIDPYPGAALWYKTDRATNARQVLYRVPGGSTDDVAAYYQNKLAQLGGAANGDTCIRFPASGNYEAYDKGDKTIPPYRFSCLFDRSGFQVSQYTRVNIQAGNETNDSVGMVIIENEQYWQR